MSCCAPGADASPIALVADADVVIASRALGAGLRQVELSVPGVHCASCISTVEHSLSALDGVESARVNLSSRRVTVRFRDGTSPRISSTLGAAGYPAHPAEDTGGETDTELSRLLRGLAVSGFAASNIMLLSVSVWSGADGATRDLFHYVSALIALPALVFAGGVFYRSAWNALSHGRMNMDVPIAVGVTLAYAMSLFETVTHGQHAYFDAAVSLLFFLLIGRTLDHVMRDRARAAVLGLARLAPRGALVLAVDGQRDYRPVPELQIGDRILLAAGDRVPVDVRVEEGSSEIDLSVVTGESVPVPVSSGAALRAGSLNVGGPLTVIATRTASDSFLAEMLQMLEAAEGGRTRYRRIAERVSALYAPVVHLGALLTFIGWLAVAGDWHHALTVAIAVLIITCPCALGLAVPIVHVVAARRLFEAGVMVKDGSALERLAETDRAVFDKTGTLTLGQPRLANAAAIDPDLLGTAADLARLSRHPLSRAIAAVATGSGRGFSNVVEHPGFGIEGRDARGTWRLGRAAWARQDGDGDGTVIALDGIEAARFDFDEDLRDGAPEAVAWLGRHVGEVEMLSGDGAERCSKVAATLGISSVQASLLPQGKVSRLADLQADGFRPLMVGDGLNDAPALAAAHVSMAPASAADVGRAAADVIYLRASLDVIPLVIRVARRARALVRQNIVFAIAYNVIAVPIAVLGQATPLVAAIAMSLSSVVVIGNALRLMRPSREDLASQAVSGEPA